MRTFTIEATSAESALGFVSALSDFDAAMIRTVHGTNLVRVTINGDIHKACGYWIRWMSARSEAAILRRMAFCS